MPIRRLLVTEFPLIGIHVAFAILLLVCVMLLCVDIGVTEIQCLMVTFWFHFNEQGWGAAEDCHGL